MEMEIYFPGNKRVNAVYKGFTVKTDQPVGDGGDNSAPEPFDLFLASIGTCAGVYVTYFCQERNIPTHHIKLILRFTRDEDTNRVKEINIKIALPSEFPEKYTPALVRVVNLCTVKKHLENPPDLFISTVRD